VRGASAVVITRTEPVLAPLAFTNWSACAVVVGSETTTTLLVAGSTYQLRMFLPASRAARSRLFLVAVRSRSLLATTFGVAPLVVISLALVLSVTATTSLLVVASNQEPP
jgi:hypothetical protein